MAYQSISRPLNSVATSTFIKYFDHFKTLDRELIISQFRANNENWEAPSDVLKANAGIRIFRENRELEALEYVIFVSSPNNIPNGQQVKLTALDLYEKYVNKQVSSSKVNNVEGQEKFVLVKYRLQQSKFRKDLFRHWGGCSITGITNPTLLIASHIKPYSECSVEEMYDFNNGLLLTPLYDKLFDSLLISFNQDGKILISKD